MKSIQDIESEFDIVIIPTEIKGNRWSCTMLNEKALPLAQPVRIQISGKTGFIIYSSKKLDDKKCDELEMILREWSVR